jgi:hypothetical protein
MLITGLYPEHITLEDVNTFFDVFKTIIYVKKNLFSRARDSSSLPQTHRKDALFNYTL